MSNTVTPYFYKHQFRSVILQFMQCFAWLHINHAKEGDDEQIVSVPVHYGLKDRVAAAILAGNTQNSVMRLPSIAVYLSAIDLAHQHLKGYGVPATQQHLPYGGSFPDDVRVIVRQQPTPLYLHFSVSIVASNLDEKFQILEQILALFARNYQIQLQTSSSDIVANKIVSIEMETVGVESTYPPGTERRSIVHDLQFKALVYFSGPQQVMDTLIKNIQLRLAAIDQYDVTTDAADDIEGYVFEDLQLVNLRE